MLIFSFLAYIKELLGDFHCLVWEKGPTSEATTSFASYPSDGKWRQITANDRKWWKMMEYWRKMTGSLLGGDLHINVPLFCLINPSIPWKYPHSANFVRKSGQKMGENGKFSIFLNNFHPKCWQVIENIPKIQNGNIVNHIRSPQAPAADHWPTVTD